MGTPEKTSSADPEFMHISDIVGWKMLLLSSVRNHSYRVIFFSATRNEIQVLESGLVSACTICIWVIRLIVNECSYQYGPRASLKIDSDLHLHVSISGLEGKMVLYFPKYCYMRFESCPFVLKCMCYCLVFETGANAILGNGETQKATHTWI